jgi:hypothetical protein
MVTRACVALTLSLVALVGCYDLERLDPGPESPYLLVDDFDDQDPIPSVRGFGRWSAYPFENSAEDNPEPVVGFGGGDNGGSSLFGEFEFRYPGNNRYTGASLGVQALREPLDVGRFRALHVTARFDSGSTSLPPNARFYADLNCDSAPPLGNVTAPLWVTKNMVVTNDWQQFRLDGFDELTSEPDRIAGGPPACLAVVDGIRFTVSTDLPGQITVSGRFFIDDVYFE